MSRFDPAKWVEVADNLGIDVVVADHPDAPGCWLLMIGPPGHHTRDADALLEVLRPDHRETEANERALAEYLLAAGRYREFD